MEYNLLAGSSPHIRSSESTRKLMLDVIIALTPAAAAAVFFFGLNALLIIIVTVASCMVSEYISTRLMKKPSTISDLSAVVTGMLLAFNLSPSVPLWVAAIGGAFAVVIVKQLFGGLGHNFVNPALAARAFLMASWPVYMTTWQNPAADPISSATYAGADAVSSATPLAMLKMGAAADALPSLTDLFTGNVAGCIGETSVLALLIGAAYLLIKRVISIEIPAAFIGTVGVMTWIFGGDRLFTGSFLYHIMAGGLIIGAFFMATDYSTSPVTARGRIIMGVGCGLLTSVIRLYGGYPEGVSYSILLMNLVVPLIDRYMVPKSFGGVKVNA
ncbi:electron transport complex protein RnfD [Anaerobacterium chartisolvens]|uniref:Ion-translocating oxidoreductase complex subunit D n=1 Tax=Anaerobacterium chartisolvens TaxID=1297424 RepID=A0A369B9C3_9FIRM|nr:RnfABCDGE type electron transport complex subunit D [Anaerobacterium chartisolvens]RCX16274.1 electron transport complex protein RnfD [Anaerobacterium chartisolvens]